MIICYDNTKDYKVDKCGELFWNIFYYAQNILYIYPKFYHWFKNKVISGLSTGDRLVFASYNDKNQMTGYLVLKDSPCEQKICTLQVLPDFRHFGYGRELLNLSLKILKNPIITVSDSQYNLYTSLLSEFNFKLIETLRNKYTDNSIEYVFQNTK